MPRAAHTERTDARSLRRVAPGPHGAPLLGSVPDLQRRGQVRFFMENWRAYGDVVRFRLGPFVGHILAHPDHIQQVLAGNAHNYSKGPSYAKAQSVIGSGLLTSEGDLWRRQRRLVQPSFTQRSTLQLAGTIRSTVEAMLARWAIAARQHGFDR
jgi:cytochrome P450